jgi:hypothetical protein
VSTDVQAQPKAFGLMGSLAGLLALIAVLFPLLVRHPLQAPRMQLPSQAPQAQLPPQALQAPLPPQTPQTQLPPQAPDVPLPALQIQEAPAVLRIDIATSGRALTLKERILQRLKLAPPPPVPARTEVPPPPPSAKTEVPPPPPPPAKMAVLPAPPSTKTEVLPAAPSSAKTEVPPPPPPATVEITPKPVPPAKAELPPQPAPRTWPKHLPETATALAIFAVALAAAAASRRERWIYSGAAASLGIGTLALQLTMLPAGTAISILLLYVVSEQPANGFQHASIAVGAVLILVIVGILFFGVASPLVVALAIGAAIGTLGLVSLFGSFR